MKKRINSVFFNASVILTGLKSPKGGSGKILSWVNKGKIKGVEGKGGKGTLAKAKKTYKKNHSRVS